MRIGIKRTYLLQNRLNNSISGINRTILGCLMQNQAYNNWSSFGFTISVSIKDWIMANKYHL